MNDKNFKSFEEYQTEQQKEYVDENHQIEIQKVEIENPYKTNNSTFPKDLNPKKQQKKFQRPTFSKYVNSYEIDLGFFKYNEKLTHSIYLVLININTRFVYIVPIADKTTESIKKGISNLIYYGKKITNVRYDREMGLNSEEMKKFWKSMDINFYRTTSKYTNRTRIVDRFIRTLRDLYFNTVGIENLNYKEHHEIIQQIVTIYNNTKHSSIQMKPSEMNYSKEYKYIARMKEISKKQRRKQYEEGLYDFKNGDRIKIFLNVKKTSKVFEKKRGNYIHDAVFKEYKHGNVVCLYENKEIEIPIYWMKPKEKK
jgi:hypothetical protein